MRILKVTLLSLFGLVALLLVAVVTITATIDPNDYKADIESAVAQNTNLKLYINGELGWSFIPLGVDINKVALEHLDGQPFTKVNQLTAQVGLLSLLKFNPQVHRVILDGLEVTLEKNEQGEGNWENIVAKSDSQQPNSTPSETPADSQQSSSQSDTSTPESISKDFQLEVEEVAITNTTINYNDKQTNQSASLEGFSLLANNISLGNEFPLSITFNASNSAPKLDIRADINANITVGSDLKKFTIKQLKSSYTLAGEPFGGKVVPASLNSTTIIADLTEDSASLDQVVLSLANLSLSTTLDIEGLTKGPQLSGSIKVADFSLQKLLGSMGQPAIKTADSSVLNKVGFSTDISGGAEAINLSNIGINLDDTQYTGSLNYRAEGQFVGAKINGTTLNVDRYLPPEEPQSVQANSDAKSSSAGSASSTADNQPESPLLPLETVRSLNLDISFIQQKLIAKNLKLNDITLLMKAGDGVITVSEASGKLYEGNFDINAIIDATSDTPKWTLNKKINNIQIMPLLQDFQNIEIISGGINANASIKTAGNTVSTLKKAIKGKADFNFDKGALHGFNLTKLTCEGVALINRDTITKSDWTNTSEFQAMKGQFTIKGNQFTNNNLTAAMSGLALVGNGAIDVDALSINYGIDLKAIGDLGDKACRVNEKIKGLAIPVICKGDLTSDPAGLCKLDSSRLQELVTAAGKKELERKADKEIDKQLDKYLGDGEEQSDTKKSVKKLFKKLF